MLHLQVYWTCSCGNFMKVCQDWISSFPLLTCCLSPGNRPSIHDNLPCNPMKYIPDNLSLLRNWQQFFHVLHLCLFLSIIAGVQGILSSIISVILILILLFFFTLFCFTSTDYQLSSIHRKIWNINNPLVVLLCTVHHTLMPFSVHPYYPVFFFLLIPKFSVLLE